MQENPKQTFVLASADPALLSRSETVLMTKGPVRVAMTADAALKTILDEPPALALIDACLPGMELGQLLAAIHADAAEQFPIVLVSDTVSKNLKNRLDEGVIDDLVAPDAGPRWLNLRIDLALRAAQRLCELERLREQSALDADRDPLTGIHNRAALMRSLLCETDRVQRMNTELCYILFDIDDFRHWNARLGTAACDQLLVKVVERTGKLLRSYDLFGRVGKDEFLAGLPGCSGINGAGLAERMRAEVFGEPFDVAGRIVRLSACFAPIPSRGRSPIVVLREAEEMLRVARADGPDTIQYAVGCSSGSVQLHAGIQAP